MRLFLIPAILLGSLVAPCAHAQVSTVKQANIADTSRSASSRVALQQPFDMPASEREDLTENPSWTAPQKPIRIYGNTWNVGPTGLGVFLITARTGDVLIDGGVPGGASQIEANIRQLGVNLRDIKWILNSHAHFDHAGDIAQLMHDTGAQMIANAGDAPLLKRGGHDDPEYGNRFPFPPVHATRTVNDGESLHLGALVLTAHSTPGHTKGNTTWTWMSCEGKRCLHMIDVASLSAPGYKLIGNPRYPDIVNDFEHSFAVVAALPCDVALAPHPGVVNFWARVARREQGDPNAMIDPSLCRAITKDARESFEVLLAKQRADTASAK
jgi:metallo-beta-lactamase class B